MGAGVVYADCNASRIIPILRPANSPLSFPPYQPVALPICMENLVERMILFCIVWFMENNNRCPNTVSGFLDITP